MIINPTAFHGNGMNITSHGVLKVLIVMAQFPDDNFEPTNAEWPLDLTGAPQPAPIWVQHPEILVTSIDQHVPGTAFTYSPGSLSEFYYTMTQNLPEEQRLKVYGDVVHYVFPFTREQMRTYVGPNNPNQGMTVATGLDILFNGLPGIPGLQLPAGRTYANYDNWSSTAEFNHFYQPDDPAGNRYVDLVIVCWRNIARQNEQAPVTTQLVLNYLNLFSWTFPTRAGFSTGVDFNDDILVPGGYRLQSRFYRNGATSGASIWFSDFLEKDPIYRSTGIRDGNFRGLVHEIGHHLLGGHFTGGPWTMLQNNDNRAYCPTAFEMSELGWITPTLVFQDQSVDFTQSLGDLYTTGDAVAIEIDAVSNKWYFLENHQMISAYDFTSAFDNVRNDGRGLYVLYHYDHEQSLQSATGAYDWPVEAVVYKEEWNNANVPIFTQGAANNQTGYTRSELVYVDVTQPDGREKTVHPILLVAANNPDGYTDENYFAGKYAGDQHEPCVTGLWGPATNPANTFVNRTTVPPTVVSTETSFRIMSESGGVMQIHIANNNADILPPARVTQTTVPTMEIPDPVVAYNTPCIRTVVVEWTASVSETDFDHFLITGGDVPVTAPTTATSASITITVGANEGYTSRWIDVFTVDVTGNVSCNALDGSKKCDVLSCPNDQQKPAWEPVLHTPNKQPMPTVLRVYPQPAREQVTLEISGMRNLTSSVVAHDALGGSHPLVYSTSNASQDTMVSTLQITLDVAELAAGMYSVMFQAEHRIHTLPILIY